MTGFARESGSGNGYDWGWEVKSVNNKNIDIRIKLPSFLDGFDIPLKKLIAEKIARGTIFVNLTINKGAMDSGFVINEAKLAALIEVAQKFSDNKGIGNASIDGLLRVKGVVEEGNDVLEDTVRKNLEKSLSESLTKALGVLVNDRSLEGERMQSVLIQQLDDIEQLAGDARLQSKDRTAAMQTRFTQQLEKLQTINKPVDDERLAQEVALLAVKADVMEELDRLDSHVVEAKKLLSSDKPVGRRLDFLCQEFNREANTLCAKSGDTKLTKIGLDIKTLIDQFREQVQNIE